MNLSKTLRIFLLILLASSYATAQNDNAQEVRKLERAWLDAYEKYDAKAMNEIVADDFTITFTNGSIQTKPQIIKMINRPRSPNEPPTKFYTDDVQARVYGDTVILIGRVTSEWQQNGKTQKEENRYTDTYVKRNGRWQVVASHLSNVPKSSSQNPAASSSGAKGAVSVQAPKALDRRDLESFLDGFFAEQMPKYKIPGAVFVVVKDGEIFFAKGFGYADIEKKQPVDADKTLFRAYSVSKSFTATAVMQLVEQGKLKLDEDVNKYLKRFKIKDDFTEPVTLADLLTHRAGFGAAPVETQLAQGKYRILDLGEYLKKNLPKRATPPGKSEYSNFGSALAGFVVEEVSGEPFAEYVAKHILKPLGMNRSTFLLPSQLPAKTAAHFAASYAIENGASRRMRLDEGDFSVAPAANLLTTGTDIARFMIAHLQNGRYENARLLSEETAQKMHQPWLYADTPKDFGYGFFWRAEMGQRVMFHAGGYESGNVNLMQLIPERKIGFFLSFTHGGVAEKRDMRAALASQFMARYFEEK